MSPLIVTAGADSYLAASSGQRFILKWDSLAFPVVVLTATPGNLQVSTQAGADSWYWLSDQAGEHSLTVNADISIPTTRVDARESQMYSDYFGDISYEIIVPLQAPGGQDPESGEIMISGGSGNVTIHIVIESSVSVRLEIDADGDGTVDDYHYTTWSALRG